MGDSRKSGTNPILHRVLVADDDADARNLMTAALIMAGFSVTQAHDGQELYDILTSAPPGYFHAVVADQTMPYLQGVEVLARAGARAPFVIVSGDTQHEAASAAEHFGAYAFFRKPFDVYDLVDAVARLVDGDRTPPERKDDAA